MPRWSYHLLPLVLATLALACNEGPEPPPTQVTVHLGPGILEPGEERQAIIIASDGSGRELSVASATFASSSPGVATIGAMGLVQARAPGSAEISATVRGTSGKATLQVGYEVAEVSVTLASSVIDEGDTTRASVGVTSRTGAALTDRPATFASTNENIVTVGTDGLVSGVARGSAGIVATVEGVSDTTAIVVQVAAATLVASHDSIRLDTGGSLMLDAQVFDDSGALLAGRSIAWSSTDNERVTVSAVGLATWMGPGLARVVARSGRAADTVVVSTAGDVAVAGVHLTQGVQDLAGTVPMIAGRATAVHVLVRSSASTGIPVPVTLRVFDTDGAAVFSETDTVIRPIGMSPTISAPSAVFLVPATHVRPGSRWQVLLNADTPVPDDTAANDRYPRGDSALLAAEAVPPFRVRFVPITLTSHNNHAPALAADQLPEYLHAARASMPLGNIQAVVGAAFPTAAVFGSGTQGGAAPFWTEVLAELDLARSTSSDPTEYWYGVVSPPPGFTFTTFGGFGYVPASVIDAGPATRTAVGVRIGWFTNPTQARELVAHEWGHNFGRRHSPCGNPSGPDPGFPNPDGRIGVIMHDVHSWSVGLTQTLREVSASAGDLMSYCYPLWASAYTYMGIMNARSVSAHSTPATRPREEVIVVQGHVASDGVPTLEPPAALRVARTEPVDGSSYAIEGVDARGTVLFRRGFRPAVIDHVDIQPFTVALPIAQMRDVRLLRVVTPAGSASLRTASERSGVVERIGDQLRVSCGTGRVRVAVQDALTNELLGVGHGEVRVPLRHRLRVSCAIGLMPHLSEVNVP